MNFSKRLASGLLFAVVGATSIAGCNFLKKATLDAGTVEVEAAAAEPTASAAASADEQAMLPLECENYLAQYGCYLTKTKKDLKPVEDMRASLTLAATASQQSAIDMCNGQLTAKLNEFKAQGCTSAAVATTTTTTTVKVDAGAKDASTALVTGDAATAADGSATATGDAAVAAAVDAGRKCTRAQECPETDACQNSACVTKCKGQVWVDSAKACGDVCSNSALLGKKCADGFVCTPHGRGVGGCIKK